MGSHGLRAFQRWTRRLREEIQVLGLVYRDPRTPWYAKACLALVLGYAFSPVDLIPDFIPVLGHLDDLLLVPLGVWLALRLIPRQVLAEARARTGGGGDAALARNAAVPAGRDRPV